MKNLQMPAFLIASTSILGDTALLSPSSSPVLKSSFSTVREYGNSELKQSGHPYNLLS